MDVLYKLFIQSLILPSTVLGLTLIYHNWVIYFQRIQDLLFSRRSCFMLWSDMHSRHGEGGLMFFTTDTLELTYANFTFASVYMLYFGNIKITCLHVLCLIKHKFNFTPFYVVRQE